MKLKFKIRIKTTLTNFARCTRFGTHAFPPVALPWGTRYSIGPTCHPKKRRYTVSPLLLPWNGAEEGGNGLQRGEKAGLRLAGGGGAARELHYGEALPGTPAVCAATVRGPLAMRARTHGGGFAAAAARRAPAAVEGRGSARGSA
jgi:hypothetical protein